MATHASLPRLIGPAPASRRGPSFRRGFTLLELITVLTLAALTMAELLPAASRLADRMAVVGAREEVVGLFHRARMEAVLRGGATLVLASEPPSGELWAAGERIEITRLEGSAGVSMGLSRGRDRVEIVFDALGLGRVASQTVRFVRGEAQTLLVVSSLGRVTRP